MSTIDDPADRVRAWILGLAVFGIAAWAVVSCAGESKSSDPCRDPYSATCASYIRTHP